MIVSWDWLKEYVPLEMSVEELTDRLTMTGLNLEGIETVGNDTTIDLEVTSNRPDCLGHLGVAREINVLFDVPLKTPEAKISADSKKTNSVTSVENQALDTCPQYMARVIEGVKIGPSPEWMQKRLASLGIASINNVVDVTNYVLMECGQPLHTFDLDKLDGKKIIVRNAKKGEKFKAINDKEYTLEESMCVIADASNPVALAGVMGGLDSEISDQTTNVLIETANFAPLAVRAAARRLSLHSDSSYRFERQVDIQQLDWASRRCCELILKLAGGTLLDEPIIAGDIPLHSPEPITIRWNQIPRILGIEISTKECTEILKSLGAKVVSEGKEESQFTAPSWRADLTREADLIEEIVRVYGYEHIPENDPPVVVGSAETVQDQVLKHVHRILTGYSFFESITLTFVSDEMFRAFTPHGERPAHKVEHSSRKKENVLRQSLVPSLLQSRRENERKGTFDASLYEVARVFLSDDPTEVKGQPLVISLVTGKSYRELKGLVEALSHLAGDDAVLKVEPSSVPQFVNGRGAELSLNGNKWGCLGELDRSVTDPFDLRDVVTVAEIDLSVLIEATKLVPQAKTLHQFPAISRDLNFVIDDSVTWSELSEVVKNNAGELLEDVTFDSQYRGKQIEVGKKSYVIKLHFRAEDRTLTTEEVDKAQTSVIEACQSSLAAHHRG